MSLEKKLQDDIANRARAYTPSPKAESWEQIQARLEVPQRKRRSFIWLWLLLAGMTVGLSMLGVSTYRAASAEVAALDVEQAAVLSENASTITAAKSSVEPDQPPVSKSGFELPAQQEDSDLTTQLSPKPKIEPSTKLSSDISIARADLDSEYLSKRNNSIQVEIGGTENTSTEKSKVLTGGFGIDTAKREKLTNESLTLSTLDPRLTAVKESTRVPLENQVEEAVLARLPELTILNLRKLSELEYASEPDPNPWQVVLSVPTKKLPTLILPELSLVLSAGRGYHQVEQAAASNEPVGFPSSTLVEGSSLISTTYGLGLEACFTSGLIIALGVDRTQLDWTAALAQPDQQAQDPIEVGDLFTGQPLRVDTLITVTNYELRRSTNAAYLSGYAGLGYRYQLGRWNFLALGNVHHGQLAHVNGSLFADQPNDPGNLYDDLQLNSSARWWWSARAGAEMKLNSRLALRATVDWRQRLEPVTIQPGSSAISSSYGGYLGVRFMLRQ